MSEVANAVAAPSCTPVDGPAVSLYISDKSIAWPPSPPYFRVTIWEPVDHLRGQLWPLGGEHPNGAAWCAGEVEAADGGEVQVNVHFDSATDTTTLQGLVDLRFSGPWRYRTRFHATWIALTARCG